MGKMLTKNFSNTKEVLITTISSTKAHDEMIGYTYLLPCKYDICKQQLPTKQENTFSYRVGGRPYLLKDHDDKFKLLSK